MNKFLALLFVFGLVAIACANNAASSEEASDDEFDLSKPAAFIQKHLGSESEALQAEVMEGIRDFQDMNITSFKSRFDKWPAHVQKLFGQ